MDSGYAGDLRRNVQQYAETHKPYQEMIFDYKAELTGIGNRSNMNSQSFNLHLYRAYIGFGVN